METSPYETIAQSFLTVFPVDTVVTGSQLQDWVKDHADGAMIKPDLIIADPKKRISTLRRHLNQGARSDNLPEAERFQLVVEDAKRQTFIVRSHKDIVQDQADGAVAKSVIGALSPLKSSKKAIANVKLDELPQIERETLETARENITAMEKAVKPTLQQEIKRVWIARLASRGVSAEDALKLLDNVPEVTRMQKLLKATS